MNVLSRIHLTKDEIANKIYFPEDDYSADKKAISTHISINCYLQELVNLFNSTDNESYCLNMKEQFEQDFEYGEVSHVLPINDVSIEYSEFLHNLRWLYIKYFKYTVDGFVVTLSTLNNVNIKKGCVQGIRAIYVIKVNNTNLDPQQMQNFAIILRLHIDIDSSNPVFKQSMKLLNILKQGLQAIPNIIINRRIKFQQIVDINKCIINNHHCVNCMRKLSSFYISYFKICCNLCGYNICRRCIIKRKIYKSNIYEQIRICKKCMQRLNYCNFAEISAENIKYRQIVNDSNSYDAGYNVYKFILSQLQTNVSINKFIALLLHTNPSTLNQIKWKKLLLQYLTHHPSLEECWISSNLRTYPIDMTHYDNKTIAPNNETQRLLAVNEINYDSFVKDKNLMLICEIINNEINGLMTLIGIIMENTIHVLACNNPSVVSIYPKNESICQFMVMESKPTIVLNPSADIKCCTLPSVQNMRFQFYFSVPIYSKDKYIIGTLCTLGLEAKPISVSQYSVIRKLSDTITTIFYDQANL